MQQRRVGRAIQRGELIEQAGLRAHPFALHARAQLGEADAVGLGGADQGEQGKAQRHLKRRRRREAGASREIAADLQMGSHQSVPGST